MRHLIAALALLPASVMAQTVPPWTCNTDEARVYMAPHAARQLFVPPSDIVAIGTLGGAGGDGGAHGKPSDPNYSSEVHCPIRVTLAGGGHRFMVYHERYSKLYGEEVKFTPFDAGRRDPTLTWVDTELSHR